MSLPEPKALEGKLRQLIEAERLEEDVLEEAKQLLVKGTDESLELFLQTVIPLRLKGEEERKKRAKSLLKSDPLLPILEWTVGTAEIDHSEMYTIFLYIYRRHFTSAILLKKLKDLYENPALTFCFDVEPEDLRKSVKRFLCVWTSRFFDWDFKHNRKLFNSLLEFVQEHLKDINVNELKMRFLHSDDSSVDFRSQIEGNTETLLAYKSSKVARQMTLIDIEFMHQLQPQELFDQNWQKHDRLTRAPVLSALADRFNLLSASFVRDIVMPAEKKARAQVIKKYIKIGWRLYNLNNFNSLMAVLAALSNNCVLRLKDSWALVPSSVLNQKHELEYAMSEKRNFRTYRSITRTRRAEHVSFVPYVALVLRDVLFADSIADSVTIDGAEMTNLHKVLVTGRLFAELMDARNRPLPCKRDYEIYHHLLRPMAVDLERLYEESIVREPPALSLDLSSLGVRRESLDHTQITSPRSLLAGSAEELRAAAASPSAEDEQAARSLAALYACVCENSALIEALFSVATVDEAKEMAFLLAALFYLNNQFTAVCVAVEHAFKSASPPLSVADFLDSPTVGAITAAQSLKYIGLSYAVHVVDPTVKALADCGDFDLQSSADQRALSKLVRRLIDRAIDAAAQLPPEAEALLLFVRNRFAGAAAASKSTAANEIVAVLLLAYVIRPLAVDMFESGVFRGKELSMSTRHTMGVIADFLQAIACKCSATTFHQSLITKKFRIFLNEQTARLSKFDAQLCAAPVGFATNERLQLDLLFFEFDYRRVYFWMQTKLSALRPLLDAPLFARLCERLDEVHCKIGDEATGADLSRLPHFATPMQFTSSAPTNSLSWTSDRQLRFHRMGSQYARMELNKTRSTSEKSITRFLSPRSMSRATASSEPAGLVSPRGSGSVRQSRSSSGSSSSSSSSPMVSPRPSAPASARIRRKSPLATPSGSPGITPIMLSPRQQKTEAAVAMARLSQSMSAVPDLNECFVPESADVISRLPVGETQNILLKCHFGDRVRPLLVSSNVSLNDFCELIKQRMSIDFSQAVTIEFHDGQNRCIVDSDTTLRQYLEVGRHTAAIDMQPQVYRLYVRLAP